MIHNVDIHLVRRISVLDFARLAWKTCLKGPSTESLPIRTRCHAF